MGGSPPNALDYVQKEYGSLITSYVDKCPFHLFDRKRQQNISRSELKDDIAAALRLWIKAPVTCSQIVRVIAEHSYHYDEGRSTESSARIREEVRGRVSAAMAKFQMIDDGDDKSRFISQLKNELEVYNSTVGEPVRFSRFPRPISVDSVCDEVDRLIDRTDISITGDDVSEQIAQFGQYAILSHRWCQDGAELLFRDVPYLSGSAVQIARRQSFEKFRQFSKVVESLYGCRYLWMDTLCIDKSDEEESTSSIPQMFDWYRHAYVCVIRDVDGWKHRGWTLQEFLAARRVKYISDQRLGHRELLFLFDVPHGLDLGWDEDLNRTVLIKWRKYIPEPQHALALFHLMHGRETTVPQDMVYCLISALDLTGFPVLYKRGFDTVFYWLQVACLEETQDRRLLLWDSRHPSHQYHSMLAADMKAFESTDWVRWLIADYCAPTFLPNPTITFNADRVMRIMLSLHPWPPPRPRCRCKSRRCHCPDHDLLMKYDERQLRLRDVEFASLGTSSEGGYCHVGVLLRLVSSPDLPDEYERVGFTKYFHDVSQYDLKHPKWVYIR